MGIDMNLVDSLLAEHGKRPEDIAGENGWLKQLTKAILERALNAKLSDHLGYAKHDPAGYKSGNSRNGKTKKTLKGDFGEMEVEAPRDRDGTFEPLIVAKNQMRWTGFGDKILSMYAGGMFAKQTLTGRPETMTELKNRGMKDVFVACVDGLKGFPAAIEAVFPQALTQLCIVHLVRHSLNFVSWKQRRQVAASLRPIYTAATREAAEQALNEFAAQWDKSHPSVAQVWRPSWEHVTPFFAFPDEIRKIIDTTVAVESLNSSLRQDHQNARFVSQ